MRSRLGVGVGSANPNPNPNQHATHRFELPPNPHLTREQQAAWIEQVAQLPAQKREAAFDALQRETGLGREELGLPPEAKEEL